MNTIHYIDAKGPAGVRLYAIGDVHGRLDLLEAMLAQIDAHLAIKPPTDWRVILLGDYVDRGPNSAGVLQKLAALRSDPHFVLLGGNHDFGFLDFMRKPQANSLFAHHGGDATAASYGVRADFTDDVAAITTAEALSKAMPARHLELLESLGRSASFGDFFFCHAGIRPGLPLEDQDPDTLIWIRNDFLDWTELHPKVVVHGHTPVEEPEVLPNRVNVDTMAYRSGRLTALVIDGATKELRTAEGAAIR